jgi:glycosyltransferase involved in cell wall biosynthesis
MEARKQPLEILTGFTRAIDDGLDAELLFIGNKSASAESINRTILGAIEGGYPVTWVQGASDGEVYDLINGSSAFLSIGIEGYGIPVLEAIRLGTPVLFDGIQPAGDLMSGHGARRVDAASPDAMAWMFGEYGSTAALDGLRAEFDSTNVPTWTDFAWRVARSAASI